MKGKKGKIEKIRKLLAKLELTEEDWIGVWIKSLRYQAKMIKQGGRLK